MNGCLVKIGGWLDNGLDWMTTQTIFNGQMINK